MKYCAMLSLLVLALVPFKALAEDAPPIPVLPDLIEQRDSLFLSQYHREKALQVEELAGIWFPSWRPQAVSMTYLRLNERLAGMDMRQLSPKLQAHMHKVQRYNLEIAELLVPGKISEVMVLALSKDSVKDPGSHEAQQEVVVQLIRELRAEEESLVASLRLR